MKIIKDLARSRIINYNFLQAYGKRIRGRVQPGGRNPEVDQRQDGDEHEGQAQPHQTGFLIL
jgi:hypothetical protein